MAASGPEKSPEGDDSGTKLEPSESASPSENKPESSAEAAAEPAAGTDDKGGVAGGDTAAAATESENAEATDSAGSETTAPSGAGAQEAADPATSGAPPAVDAKPVELHSHHVSKILDEVLQEPSPSESGARFKHPMILDVILALGLLVAMGGFTVGMFKMYLTHSAEQSITQNNYKAAIAILKGAPLPGFFTIPGSDPEELLAQALYLDALDRLEVEKDTDGALKQLQEIRPGSRYFTLAQKIIEDHHRPSSTFLQGGTEHVEDHPDMTPEKKPILPDLPPDGSL